MVAAHALSTADLADLTGLAVADCTWWLDLTGR